MTTMIQEQTPIMVSTDEVKAYFSQERFDGIKRLYTARQVGEQQGTIFNDYSIAKQAAKEFFDLLREKFESKKQITTFGPYSPSQAVMMKRAGIEGIYLGGWATSAKGSMDEDPGPDLASYPLSQVPNEAAGIVRALLTADKNQYFTFANQTEDQRKKSKIFDFRPFIIADADTGHGGEAHVRNLVRRFVEAGVPGYHIEDQKPGTKKCGHQGGKVLVSVDEQIKRLNAARFQLDVMRVPGLIVARTDAEAANLLENMNDERDQPFILGATNLNVPSYKSVLLAFHSELNAHGVEAVMGHNLYALPEEQMVKAKSYLEIKGFMTKIEDATKEMSSDVASSFESLYDKLLGELVAIWEEDARVKTISQAFYDIVKQYVSEGTQYDMTLEEIKALTESATIDQVKQKASEMGIDLTWDYRLAQTTEGYYQVKGGIPYAIAKSLAVAPYADLLWMETKTADLADAKEFADAIHAVYPDKMLAYNLSPSFNWDSTGMTEEEMMKFPEELGKMGFVFNFITYGGHQIDGLVTDEFASSLQQEGMVALAKAQRKFRLLDSPYKKPQTHVGGPRVDGALISTSARTATTKAMGKGSTEFQHAINTELPIALLNQWLTIWKKQYQVTRPLDSKLRPHSPGSNVLELAVYSKDEKIANIVFTSVEDRNKVKILNIRDQNTFDASFRRKRLVILLNLYLLNRYKSKAVHYLTPTEDNIRLVQSITNKGFFDDVKTEIGQITVAEVNETSVASYLQDDALVAELLSV